KIPKLQILTHPIWWQEIPSNLHVILKNMKENCKLDTDSEFKSLEVLYKNYFDHIRNNLNQ
ncbi:MAG: hypothetical protein KGI19_11235, partial [Thaumarchaeota archaeon]|nr:hypothetical protein [Nitrososphaerota archaeon]